MNETEVVLGFYIEVTFGDCAVRNWYKSRWKSRNRSSRVVVSRGCLCPDAEEEEPSDGNDSFAVFRRRLDPLRGRFGAELAREVAVCCAFGAVRSGPGGGISDRKGWGELWLRSFILAGEMSRARSESGQPVIVVTAGAHALVLMASWKCRALVFMPPLEERGIGRRLLRWLEVLHSVGMWWEHGCGFSSRRGFPPTLHGTPAADGHRPPEGGWRAEGWIAQKPL